MKKSNGLHAERWAEHDERRSDLEEEINVLKARRQSAQIMAMQAPGEDAELDALRQRLQV